MDVAHMDAASFSDELNLSSGDVAVHILHVMQIFEDPGGRWSCGRDRVQLRRIHQARHHQNVVGILATLYIQSPLDARLKIGLHSRARQNIKSANTNRS